ncbi:HAD family hydrolase [Chengkuizengella sediminis]|uniref:HAD family hydrolase n=1 Tax=Chengkuizengella sediminis TaxID=1885917 RepID=UPI001389E090|nr:HAD family hydrolase [Chengkuizengella sediminis]NDI36237.1 HAD family hydrolase [Chengkuizengella sediminis]
MIFFDIDETILDFKGAEYQAVKEFYNKFTDIFKITEDEFYDQWCTIGKNHFTRFLKGELTFEEQKIERIKDIFHLVESTLDDLKAEQYFQIYLTYFEESWKVFDDVFPCLDQLKDYRLGIITNGDAQQQIQKLKKIGVYDYFEIIISAGDLGIAKPNTEIFKIACNKANTRPSECFYVGDDLNTDILACEKVKMRGIWLNRKNQKVETQVSWINNLYELKDKIKELELERIHEEVYKKMEMEE